jgi:hypothetical protein
VIDIFKGSSKLTKLDSKVILKKDEYKFIAVGSFLTETE